MHVAARMSERTLLTLFLIPVTILAVAGIVANALLPTLVADAPALVPALTTRADRLLLVAPLLPGEVFLGIALVRERRGRLFCLVDAHARHREHNRCSRLPWRAIRRRVFCGGPFSETMLCTSSGNKPKRTRQETVSNVPAFYAIRAKTISIMCAIIPDACAGADTK